MTNRPLAAVVMAAGLGTRMRSRVPKHFHPLLGRRMVDWVLEAVESIGADRVIVVASPDWDDAFENVEVVVQDDPRGTGDAVARVRPALEGFEGDVLVLSGDGPLVTPELLQEVLGSHRPERPAVTLVSCEPEQPLPYGRVVRDASGRLVAVVEATDATPEQLAIREMNGSLYVFDADALWSALDRLEPANAQGELYLTDAIAHLVAAGRETRVYRAADANEVQGVNTRVELAQAASILRDRVNERHMLAGVAIVDPGSTWIDRDVEIEADAVIEPFTVLRGRTRVSSGAHVGPFATVVDALVGRDALVGPFCYLRPGTVLGAGSKAGTFVELKNTQVGEGAKVPHLSYMGDAVIGAGTNIGAGNITANLPPHPGRKKERTTIGRNVKTSIHNSFIAPVTIGDDAWTAAGSVITDDVPPESLAGFPPRQVTKEGYVRRRRDN